MNPNTISPQSENVDQTTARLERTAEQVAPAVEAKSEEKAPSFWQKIRKNLFKSTAAVAVVGASFSAGHVAGEMKAVDKPEVSQPVIEGGEWGNTQHLPDTFQHLPDTISNKPVTPPGPGVFELPNLNEAPVVTPDTYRVTPPEPPHVLEQGNLVQKPIYDGAPLNAGPEVEPPKTEQMFEEPVISKPGAHPPDSFEPGAHPPDSFEPREPTVDENFNVRPPESR